MFHEFVAISTVLGVVTYVVLVQCSSCVIFLVLIFMFRTTFQISQIRPSKTRSLTRWPLVRRCGLALPTSSAAEVFPSIVPGSCVLVKGVLERRHCSMRSCSIAQPILVSQVPSARKPRHSSSATCPPVETRPEEGCGPRYGASPLTCYGLCYHKSPLAFNPCRGCAGQPVSASP